jgi:hypothetical protein
MQGKVGNNGNSKLKTLQPSRRHLVELGQDSPACFSSAMQMMHSFSTSRTTAEGARGPARIGQLLIRKRKFSHAWLSASQGCPVGPRHAVGHTQAA